MLTRTCAHTTTTREREKKEWRGFQCFGTCTQNRSKKGSAVTHMVTQTQLSSLEATGHAQDLKRVEKGGCKSRECHNYQRGWQHSGRRKWTPASWCSENDWAMANATITDYAFLFSFPLRQSPPIEPPRGGGGCVHSSPLDSQTTVVRQNKRRSPWA